MIISILAICGINKVFWSSSDFKNNVEVPETVFNHFLSCPGDVSVKIKVNTSYHFSGILFGATLHPSGQLHMSAIFFIGTPYLHFVLNCLGYVKTHGFHGNP